MCTLGLRGTRLVGQRTVQAGAAVVTEVVSGREQLNWVSAEGNSQSA